MNESVKNSFKGFRIKPILTIIAIAFAIVLIAATLNYAKLTGKGFYTVIAILSVLFFGTYGVIAFLKNKQAAEEEGQRLASIEKLATERKALADQINLMTEQYNTAINRAKALEKDNKAKVDALTESLAENVSLRNELEAAKAPVAEAEPAPAPAPASKKSKKK